MDQGVVIGNYVSEKRITLDPATIQVINNLPPPHKLKEVRRFIWQSGYHRIFIQDYSKIVAPMFLLDSYKIYHLGDFEMIRDT